MSRVPTPDLKGIIKSAAGPGFKVLASHNGCFLFYEALGRTFEAARIHKSGTEIRIEEHPSVSAMPADVREQVRGAINRARANHHYHSCEPDGRGPYD